MDFRWDNMTRIVQCLRDVLCVGLLLAQLSSADCPSMCKCANRKVDCSDRNLDLLPVFGPTLDRIVYVDIEKNSIRKLPSLGLANFVGTQTLVLKFNQIDTIEKEAFSNLTALKTLDLTGNSISSLPKGIFNDLTSLHSLDLSQNNLRNLEGLLVGLSTLYRLDISHNYLTYLTDTIFSDLQGLMYLMVGNNQIQRISRNAFSPITKLSYLVLKNNPLFNIDHRFANNRRMSYIDLTNCKLQAVPKGLPWVLRYLQLTNNNITSIYKQDLKDYNYVGVIILDQNRIENVESGTFARMSYLRELWLNGNKLSSVPDQLPLKLEFLYLDANDITSLNKNMFSGFSSLRTFSMKGNKLTEVSQKHFDKLPNVTQLYLDNNNITKISDFTFKSLANLQRLFISRNPLRYMSRQSLYGLDNLRYLQMAFIVTDVKLEYTVFTNVPNLQKLELQYSSYLAGVITESYSILKTLNNLRELNLMSAEMTFLSPILKNKLPKLSKLELADNKWHCDRNLLWLNHWMRIAKTLFVNKMDVKCFSPLHLKGTVISSMFDSQFVPATTTTIQTTTSTKASTTQADTSSKWTTTSVATRKETLTSKATIRGSTTTVPSLDSQNTEAASTTRASRSTRVVLRTRKFIEPATSPAWAVTAKQTFSTSSRGKNRTKKTTFVDYNAITPGHVSHISDPITGSDAYQVTAGERTSTRPPALSNSSVSVNRLETSGKEESSEGVNVIAIAVSISIIVLLLILGAVGYAVYRYRQNRVIYHRAIHYQQHRDMTYYITLTDSETKPAKRPSRSERGSASSVTSEDITNQEGGVKFFHWDDGD